ncbi:MAG TPA: response regulator, partial [Aeromicrobium sp.]|nr:response regulator [Aeromicrobium sp.]
VYGIVQQSGGYIYVYSEPGDGATFKVYLPAAVGASEDASAGPDTVNQHGHGLVLVVEDEDSVRRLAALVLRRAGYDVQEAGTAKEAEEWVASRKLPIDLLVTDVVMPGSSGSALYERLSMRQPGLRVLYMSGYTDDAVIRQGRLPAEATFLQKPFTGELLIRKVREILSQ